MLEYKSLKDLPLIKIVQLFNQVFADYLLPIQLTESDLKAKIKAENIDLAYSVCMFDGNSCVGFILIGVDEVAGITTAYNAGTGVIKDYRGNNLTKKMYQLLLPVLAQEGVHNHLLEVLTENTFAIKAYQKTGFQVQRKFSCYKGFLKKFVINKEIEIREISFDKLIITNDFINQVSAFQNSLTAIQRRINVHTCLGAYENERLVGFLIFDFTSFRFKQFGVHKKFRNKGIATSLFMKVREKATEREVSIINIDVTDLATISFIEKMGLRQYIQQFEMVYKYED